MRILAVVLLALAAGGCLAPLGTGPGSLFGLVYTNHTIPLTEDLKSTPAAIVVHKSNDTERITEPITGAGVSAVWDTNAFGDIAKENGLTELYFADIESFSILGIWTQETVHLYGK